ncbi:hypothetical protein C8R45DRAFT_207849 [Mycena sanguinolenta]|nr:hypothetical protein C8R45DRAFT_207849 [Mycena sanguinolenta]
MSAPLRRRLADLDAQIIEQKRQLDELQQIRSDVERELFATATFPVLALPTEIMTEIFLYCVPLFDPLCIPNGRCSAPLVLAGVCRLWRNIAHDTPALWSKLDVQFDLIPIAKASQPGLIEGLVDVWFSRARSSPLSLDIQYSYDDSSLPGRVREIIHRWAHSLQYIFLDFGSSEFDIPALGLDSAAFPLLQGARIGGYLDSNPTPTLLFSNAPRFHELSIPGETFTPRNFTLPWSQLTKFEGILNDLDLFTVAPNLTELTCSFDRNEDANFAVITHHKLTSFTINEDSDDLMQYLTLPMLNRLDVSQISRYDGLESFLARSSPHLASLSISMNYKDDEERNLYYMRKFLPLVARTLENLEFSDVSGDEMTSIFRLLNRDSFQKIRTITLKYVVEGFDLDEMIKFLYAHSDRLHAFRLFWLSSPFLDGQALSPSGTADTIGGHLSRLIAQNGMDIYLGTIRKNYVSISDSALRRDII